MNSNWFQAALAAESLLALLERDSDPIEDFSIGEIEGLPIADVVDRLDDLGLNSNSLVERTQEFVSAMSGASAAQKLCAILDYGGNDGSEADKEDIPIAGVVAQLDEAGQERLAPISPAERLKPILQVSPITVLDTCNLEQIERSRKDALKRVPSGNAHGKSKMKENDKREQAAEIISQLCNNYYYTQKRIAWNVGNCGYVRNGKKGISQSTISGLANPENMWHVSDMLLASLEAVLRDAMEKSLSATLMLLPIQVLDYCGIPSDPKHREQVEDAVRSALRSLPASPHVKLPDGVEGVLVSLGGGDSGISMVLINSDIDISRKEILAHELEHVANLLRDTLDPTEDYDSSADV